MKNIYEILKILNWKFQRIRKQISTKPGRKTIALKQTTIKLRGRGMSTKPLSTP